MAAIGGNLSPFRGLVKQMPQTKWQQNNSESGDDKENVSQNRCSSSFDFELVSSLLEKRIDHSSTTPKAVLHVETNAEDSDIENCHHPSSARNSCGKDRLGNNYEDDDEDFCAESSNHLLESFLTEQEVPIPDTVETPVKPVMDPLKKQENTASMSPTSTILTLKKGQRIKDGMILMLTGQVDRRKQLLLGAQEQAQRMSETLSSKESELSALQSKVKGLQHVVQGADGKIALLQFQLQKTKNVLKNQNQNQIASTSSTAAVAAPALISAECPSASSQVVDNVPIVLNVESKNVPHSSALTSPDRTSWLLHWRKSQNIMADIIVRSSGQNTARTDKPEHFIPTSTSPDRRNFENETGNEGNLNGNRSVALQGQTKTPVTIYRETGTSPMTSSKHCIMSTENEKNKLNISEKEDITDDEDVKTGSTEHKLIAQERLNIRLTAQLKAWVEAQIDMHTHLASSEATQILDHRFQNISNPIKVDEKTKNLNNDNRDNRTIPEKDYKSISEKYGNDDVSYDSNNKKGITNKIEGKLLDLGSPFQNSISSSSPHIVNSLPVIRTLFKEINSRQNDDNMNNNNNVDNNQNSKNNKSGSGNRVVDQNYQQKNVTSSPQYSHLLLVENNYDDDNNNCSLISDYSCHLNRMINNTTNEAQNNNLNQASKIIIENQTISPSTPLLNKIFKNDDSSIKNKKDSSKTKSPNSEFSSKSPSTLIVDTVRRGTNEITSTLSPLQEKLLRLNSRRNEMTEKNMKNIRKSVSPKTNEKYSKIIETETEQHTNNNTNPSATPTQLPRTYAESLSTVPTPLKTAATPGKIFGKLLAKKTPTREKSPKKSPMKNRDLSSISAVPCKTTDLDRIHNQNHEYLISQKYGFDSKSELAEYLINSKPDSETTSKINGISDSKNPDYGNTKNNTSSEKHGNSHKNGNGGIVEFRSLLETDSYLNLPVGRRAISRERGAATITQNKSSQLQAKLRALETESAKEREKNKGLFLLKEINSSKMLQSNYSTSFRNNHNNNSSTKQSSEMKAYNSNYNYHAETVKSRQTVTPRKSPSQKSRSVANDLALTVIENSTRLRGMGVSFSPPTRPTLSPSSFNKEMNRLKKENYSIRDDISRFRNTLQALRKECRGDNTAKYLQSVRAFDAISEMDPEPNLESLKDCTRFQSIEKNVPQERSSRNYPLSRNDDVCNNNVRYTAGQGHNLKNESKNTYGQKVGFEFYNENNNGNGNLYGFRHREEVGARISTYAYNNDTYMERMDLVDCTDMNDISVHSSSLLSNTPAPTQGRERGREGSSARDREDNNFYHTSHNNHSQYKQIQ